MTPYWISLDLATDLLLAAAGLAVAAAGFYYLVKKLRDGQKRAKRYLEKRLRQLEELICEIQRENKREIEILQTALAEAESKYEKVMKSQVQVENENLDLIFNIHLLQDTLQDYKKELHAAYRKCSMSLMEYEQEKFTHSLLQAKFKKMEGTLKRNFDSLKCFKILLPNIEKNSEKMLEANAELQEENFHLKADIILLQDRVKQKKKDLSEANRTYKTLNIEREQEKKDHSLLKSEYLKIINTIAQNEESVRKLQTAVAETETKCEQVMESSAELETDNSLLSVDLDILHTRVCKLKNVLYKKQSQHKNKTNDYQTILEHYNLLKSAYKKMVESCETFTQEKQHEQEAHNIPRTRSNQLKEVFPINKQSLKEMECTVQQISDLTSKVITLQATKQKLEEELRHARWRCHTLMAEKEQKMVAEKFQQLQYKEMKKNCKRCYELLKVRCFSSHD
ncbi:myosin-9-like isoform X2 [Tachysurus fulvidraco]|uniref:myosin-9-like isoform X2 n=1 Tax=Tachysurus fulvidraco TaxID=1234273 RepID=UPI001FF00BCB|nr:myosin-9-like isoform X2 [Tachysurus fulvidraco]